MNNWVDENDLSINHCNLNDDDLCNYDSVRKRDLTVTYNTNHCFSIGIKNENKFQPREIWSFNASNWKYRINRSCRMFSILVQAERRWFYIEKKNNIHYYNYVIILHYIIILIYYNNIHCTTLLYYITTLYWKKFIIIITLLLYYILLY